tara:strand:- start:1130 stop:1303 length:174 start_codon:yes stop_codon:yes gene_type:complete
MAEYILFIIAVIFTLISLKLITYKTGDHDTDMFLKIIGWVIFIPAIWIVLESFNIIK